MAHGHGVRPSFVLEMISNSYFYIFIRFCTKDDFDLSFSVSLAFLRFRIIVFNCFISFCTGGDFYLYVFRFVSGFILEMILNYCFSIVISFRTRDGFDLYFVRFVLRFCTTMILIA